MKKMERMKMQSNTFICSYSRTAIGAFQGSLSNIPATELGSIPGRSSNCILLPVRTPAKPTAIKNTAVKKTNK